jgi:hypothetical protein
MSHPETILRTLDGYLSRPTRLILYGRAALSLGFQTPDPSFSSTLDVDAILPAAEMSLIEADDQFWDALENTNRDLEPSGLYITHLFCDDQIILSPNWLDSIIPISLPGLKHLQLFRPATGDLILTKMMRIDPQDRQDILFLISTLPSPAADLFPLIETATLPPIPEIQEAFEANKQWLISKL